jgi:protease I
MAKRLCLGLLIVLVLGCQPGQVKRLEKSEKFVGRKALMIIAPGEFRDEELFQPKEVFEEYGLTVTVASTTKNEVTGMLGSKVRPEILLKDVDVKNYDIIVFVGGKGAKVYFDHPKALTIAIKAHQENKVIGAICIAPCILAKAGILKDKKATVWRDHQYILKEEGAKYVRAGYITDGNIVTAEGPGIAKRFAEELLRVLLKQLEEE